MKGNKSTLNIPSSDGDYGKSGWTWTRGKIAAFIGFGILLLGLLLYEILTFTPYDPEADQWEDVIEEEPSEAAGITNLSSPLESSNSIGIDTPIPNPSSSQPDTDISTQPIATNNQTSETTTNQNNTSNPSSSNTSSGTSNSTNTSNTSSTQLRLSESGEIEEITNQTDSDLAGNNSSPSQTEANNENIEEAFYTPVTVTGSITSGSDGKALNGVRISVMGTTINTTTDEDGKYAIAVPGNPENRTLRFSYRGNVSERLVAPNTRVINIQF